MKRLKCANECCTLLPSVRGQIDVFTEGLKHSTFQCTSQVPDISVLEKPNFHFGMDFFFYFFLNCSLKFMRTRTGWTLTILQNRNCLTDLKNWTQLFKYLSYLFHIYYSYSTWEWYRQWSINVISATRIKTCFISAAICMKMLLFLG